MGSSQFLGFMITYQGIEANADKIQAIIDMKGPENLHDIQKLNKHLTVVSLFLAGWGACRKISVDPQVAKGVSWAKKATKNKPITWDESYAKAFRELKEYLSKAPLLSSPRPNEDIFLYMAVTRDAGSSEPHERRSGRPAPLLLRQQCLQRGCVEVFLNREGRIHSLNGRQAS